MGVLHFSAHFQMPTQNFGYPPFFFVEAVAVADTLLENTQTLPQQHEAKLHPDVVTYNSIIAACERCGIWAKALELLNLMEEAVGFSGGGMYKRPAYQRKIWGCHILTPKLKLKGNLKSSPFWEEGR